VVYRFGDLSSAWVQIGWAWHFFAWFDAGALSRRRYHST
jgi:hypothetical protein